MMNITQVYEKIVDMKIYLTFFSQKTNNHICYTIATC